MSEKKHHEVQQVPETAPVEQQEERRTFMKKALMSVAGALATLGLGGQASAAEPKRTDNFRKITPQQRSQLTSKLKAGLKNREIVIQGGRVGRAYSDHINYSDHVNEAGQFKPPLQQRAPRQAPR